MSNISGTTRLVATALLVLTCRSGASATDLTGHWLREVDGSGNGTQFDIAQSGNVITIPLSVFNPGFGSAVTEPTLSGSTLATTESTDPEFVGQVIAGENAIDGKFRFVSLPNIAEFRLMATRCECFDGNSNDGDGCDSNCRVEPCFACTGEPSVCTAQPDGAACNDRDDCSGGETCSTGLCGGGSAVASCIDMTGRWKVETDGGAPAYLLEDLRDVEQRDGFLRFVRPRTGSLAEVGTIDPLTGALALSGGVLAGSTPFEFSSLNQSITSCQMSFAGTASGDGQSFAGTGTGTNGTLMFVGTSGVFYGGCNDGGHAFSQTGRRCGVGECVLVPDECPPCTTRNDVGVCAPGPRDGCLHSRTPARSKLQMRTGSEQKLSWLWKDGQDVPARMLGDLEGGGGLQICVYDGNSNLLFLTYFNALAGGWVTRDGARFSRNLFPRGKERVTVEPGTDGDAALRITAGPLGLTEGYDPGYPYGGPPAEGLPSPPFALPLRIQAQIDRGGACFEATFDSTTVKKNGDELFKGKASE